MHQATAEEIRVLGCLIEKQRTTPDQYPLTLNALRNACNQTTNRDPVVHYDEATVRQALERLIHRGWVRNASWAGSRAMKYRHLLDEALALGAEELAVLAVLMLRGAQTAAEVRQRCERMHKFASVEEVEARLDALAQRGLVARLPRRPGERGRRYVQLLGGAPASASTATAEPAPPIESPAPDRAAAAQLDERVAELERRVAALERALGRSADQLT